MMLFATSRRMWPAWAAPLSVFKLHILWVHVAWLWSHPAPQQPIHKQLVSYKFMWEKTGFTGWNNIKNSTEITLTSTEPMTLRYWLPVWRCHTVWAWNLFLLSAVLLRDRRGFRFRGLLLQLSVELRSEDLLADLFLVLPTEDSLARPICKSAISELQMAQSEPAEVWRWIQIESK